MKDITFKTKLAMYQHGLVVSRVVSQAEFQASMGLKQLIVHEDWKELS